MTIEFCIFKIYSRTSIIKMLHTYISIFDTKLKLKFFE